MIQKNKKICERILIAAAALILIIAGFLGGRFSAKDNSIVPVQGDGHPTAQVNVKTIAVVNGDAGTYVNDQYINYASRLLDFLDENYVMTNIEAARNGVENGTYAAYILIPSSFSDNLVSLNKTPVKANLEYAINGELIEERRVETVYRIVDFERNLNGEMSYMYLCSILDEFHDVQDGARTIMDNDIKETDTILAIQPADLIEMVPVPELVQVDNSVEPLEVSDYNNKNAEIISEIGNSYAYFINLSKSDLEALKGQGNHLAVQWGNMENTIQTIDLTTDEEGNIIYETGLADIEKWIIEYNDITLSGIERQISENSIEISCFLEERANELETVIEGYNMDTLEKNKEKAVSEIMSAINEADNGGTVSDNTIMSILDYCMTPFQDTVKSEDGEDLTVTYSLRQKSADIQSEISGEKVYIIPRIGTEELTVKIQDEIITPMEERIDGVKEQLVSGYENEKIELNHYSKMLADYSPLDNIDQTLIQEYIGEIQQNNVTLHTTIVENYTDNMEYVRDVYENTEENISILQQNIMDSKEVSDQAVENGLEEVKELKNSTSEMNQTLLADFVQKLPYTRIGNLENTQVCDFIIDPVRLAYLGDIDTAGRIAGTSDLTNTITNKAEIQEKETNQKAVWVWYVFLSILIVSLAGILVLTVMKEQDDKAKENVIS